ncbi:MAG: hypothetical protein EOM59_13300 [Clostridia bacterium]|nr:hypothetical protein [Clostridia bacterium]
MANDIYRYNPAVSLCFDKNFSVKNNDSSKTQNQYISTITTFYIKMKGILCEIANLEHPIEGQKLPKNNVTLAPIKSNEANFRESQLNAI